MNHDPKSPGCPNLAPSSLACDKSRRGERPAHRAGRAPVGIHTRSQENPPRRWPPERTRSPVGRFCPPDTALHSCCSIFYFSLVAGRCGGIHFRQPRRVKNGADKEECVASDEEGIGALAREGGKGRLDLERIAWRSSDSFDCINSTVSISARSLVLTAFTVGVIPVDYVGVYT
jgi:hypothetical protein